MSKTFKIRMSERCYRFKPDALMPHAPRKPGVYEFVTFHEKNGKLEPEVLFVGLTPAGGTLHDSIAAHMMGNQRPTAEDLFKAAKDIYFDYVDEADISSEDELKDIAGALMARHNPRLNPATPAPSSGKHTEVTLEEIG
jgi:hypothetical protein